MHDNLLYFCAEDVIGKVAFTDAAVVENVMCQAMRQGNCLYEQRRLDRLLSMDDVYSLFPDLNIQVLQESFVRFSSLQELVLDILHSEAVNTVSVAGGVFVISPHSFAILSSSTTDKERKLETFLCY